MIEIGKFLIRKCSSVPNQKQAEPPLVILNAGWNFRPGHPQQKKVAHYKFHISLR